MSKNYASRAIHNGLSDSSSPAYGLRQQKGQTLVVVLMIMILALSMGLTISSRFVKNLHNVVGADNSSKATGVAEAAVERILLLPADTLTSYINNNTCGSDCALQITDSTGQKLDATVTLSFVGNSGSSYPISIAEADAAAVSLTGYQQGRSVYVCWNDSNSIIGYYIYTQSGVTKATPFAYNAVLANNTTNGFSSASANFGYQNCFSIVASQTPIALRLHSVYGRTDVNVLPEAGFNIPVQGIKIVSTGKVGNATKIITVIKSTTFTPAYFDYSVYQKSETDALSN